jgi:hypothetical protein
LTFQVPSSVHQGDRRAKKPTSGALVQTGVGFALKRNARFYGIVMDAARQTQEAHALEVREHNGVWSRYQTLARDVIAEAKAKGEWEPDLVPHPDDIVIDWETGPRFVWPFDEASKSEMQKRIAFREALLLQAALDKRLTPIPEDDDLAKGPGTALEFAKVINPVTAAAIAHDRIRMHYMVDYYSRHPVRWLLATVYASWRQLGKRRKHSCRAWPKLLGSDEYRRHSAIFGTPRRSA